MADALTDSVDKIQGTISNHKRQRSENDAAVHAAVLKVDHLLCKIVSTAELMASNVGIAGAQGSSVSSAQQTETFSALSNAVAELKAAVKAAPVLSELIQPVEYFLEQFSLEYVAMRGELGQVRASLTKLQNSYTELQDSHAKLQDSHVKLHESTEQTIKEMQSNIKALLDEQYNNAWLAKIRDYVYKFREVIVTAAKQSSWRKMSDRLSDEQRDTTAWAPKPVTTALREALLRLGIAQDTFEKLNVIADHSVKAFHQGGDITRDSCITALKEMDEQPTPPKLVDFEPAVRDMLAFLSEKLR